MLEAGYGDSGATYQISVTLRSIVSALIMDDGERHAETLARILAGLKQSASDVVVVALVVASEIPRAFAVMHRINRYRYIIGAEQGFAAPSGIVGSNVPEPADAGRKITFDAVNFRQADPQESLGIYATVALPSMVTK